MEHGMAKKRTSKEEVRKLRRDEDSEVIVWWISTEEQEDYLKKNMEKNSYFGRFIISFKKSNPSPNHK